MFARSARLRDSAIVACSPAARRHAPAAAVDARPGSRISRRTVRSAGCRRPRPHGNDAPLQLLDTNIRAAIAGELQARGYRGNRRHDPDLRIAYETAKRRQDREQSGARRHRRRRLGRRMSAARSTSAARASGTTRKARWSCTRSTRRATPKSGRARLGEDDQGQRRAGRRSSTPSRRRCRISRRDSGGKCLVVSARVSRKRALRADTVSFD